MKRPRPPKAPKPRNVAAKSLREGRFRPRVEAHPNAYKRRPRHKGDLLPPAEDEPGADSS